MSKYIKSIIAVMLYISVFALIGCSDKEKKSSSVKESSSSKVSVGTDSDTDSDKTTEAVSASVTITTEPITVSEPDNGYASPKEAAQNYYNAYLTGNYEAIYNMFSEDEIKAYNSYADANHLIGEEKSDKALGKGNVIRAIKASIENIRDLMYEKGSLPPDCWASSFTEEDLTPVSPEELEQFNSTIGTSFTSAMDCAYVFYIDGIEDDAFVGNACALVEKNGRWYVSYSTVLSAELITFLDIF